MLLLATPILSFTSLKTQSSASLFADPPPIGSPFILALLTRSLHLPRIPMVLLICSITRPVPLLGKILHPSLPLVSGLLHISSRSLEWNDEPAEEQGLGESPPCGTDDISTQNSERKEDNVVNGTEENEWDRLLRVRWEKYRHEEEAALGRGKQQRKAVSYREEYAPNPSETLSESSIALGHIPPYQVLHEKQSGELLPEARWRAGHALDGDRSNGGLELESFLWCFEAHPYIAAEFSNEYRKAEVARGQFKAGAKLMVDGLIYINCLPLQDAIEQNAMSLDTFFASNGFPCPALQNPSNHFLKTINKDFDDQETKRRSNRNDVKSYESSNLKQQVQAEVAALSAQESGIVEKKKRGHANFQTQCIVLAKRSSVNREHASRCRLLLATPCYIHHCGSSFGDCVP
ncbi:hypothetical protein K1719_026282 [Acacia pycnantha]|nr:hypothetical protein K1719_026282 [Acacia pycnantha]